MRITVLRELAGNCAREMEKALFKGPHYDGKIIGELGEILARFQTREQVVRTFADPCLVRATLSTTPAQAVGRIQAMAKLLERIANKEPVSKSEREEALAFIQRLVLESISYEAHYGNRYNIFNYKPL